MAARSSMASSSPLDSPLEMRWMAIGGNSLLWASERPMGAPSRTLCDASMTASRIGRLVTTSPEMRRASSTGTALAERMLSVRVKRAVLKPRVSLPMSGMRRISRWKRRRLFGLRSQLLKPKKAATIPMIMNTR